MMIILILLLLSTKLTFAEESFVYEAKANRDPFVPLISEGGAHVSDAYGISSIKDVRLEGIVWDEAKGSIAIINGEIVEEGQDIGVVKVLRIEKDGVVFEIDNQEVRLELTVD